LPFGFEIGKIVKYARLNSDQLNLFLGEKPRAPAPPLAQTVCPKTMNINANLTTKVPMPIVGWCRENGWLISHS
jgi:hypothetical protein